MKADVHTAKDKGTDCPEWGPKVVSDSWLADTNFCLEAEEFLFCGANAGDWIIETEKGKLIGFHHSLPPHVSLPISPSHHSLLHQLLPSHLHNESFSPQGNNLLWLEWEMPPTPTPRPVSYGVEKARRPQDSEAARKSQQLPTGGRRQQIQRSRCLPGEDRVSRGRVMYLLPR